MLAIHLLFKEPKGRQEHIGVLLYIAISIYRYVLWQYRDIYIPSRKKSLWQIPQVWC